jgi:hypothetical protein
MRRLIFLALLPILLMGATTVSQNLSIQITQQPHNGACPMGSAYTDGCASAPICTPGTNYCYQQTNFFTGYTGVNYGANRPPWNVAGVDYPVGINSSCSGGGLKDPTANPPAGTSYNGNNLKVTGTNVTIDCYDFSLHNGVGITITPSARGTVTVTNSYWRGGSAINNGFAMAVFAPSSNCGATGVSMIFNNNYIDTTGNTSTSFESYVNWVCNGPITIEYNYFKNSPKDFTHLAGSSSTGSFTMRYNYGQGMARAAGAHGQPMNNYGQHGSGDIESWNTWYGDGGEGANAGVTALCNFDGGAGEANPTCANNTLVGGAAYMVYMTGESSSAMTGTMTVSNNYMDFRNSYGPYYPNIYQYTTVSTGNVNMINGHSCNAYAASYQC